jgi:hypothetical protein
MDSVIEMASNNFSATWISRHQNILTDISFFKMYVVL